MSLRPEVRGFSLAKFRTLFGSRDQSVIDAIEASFAESVEEEPEDFDQEYRGTFHKALHRAIEDGVPFPSLEVEGEPHVHLALLMASYEQEYLPTDSSDWKMIGFWDFWELCGDLLSPEGRRLFSYLIEGRPLFGRQIESSWSYYAYLERQEVDALRAAFRELWEANPDLHENELIADLVADLTRWCEEISSRGMDLWFWTA
jgi:hypothetical protein